MTHHVTGGSDPGRRSLSRGRAIVTGGAGFIGSHLVERLSAEGLSVLVVDDLSNGGADRIPDRVPLEQRDIAQPGLTALFRSWRPTLVFHLAAQSSVPFSIQDPLRDLAVNVVGTHHVAAAARAAGADRLVFVSSGGAIYGETRRRATEESAPAPISYYGIHKFAAEGHVALAGIPYAIARPSNVYGPGQLPGVEGAVVAAFFDQARKAGRLMIHGDGTQTRDFVHVSDAVEALWLLGRTPAVGIWNVSSGRAVAVATLADLVERYVGVRLERSSGPQRLGDVQDSSLASTRLRRLGWRPRVSLVAGVRQLARKP